MKLRFCPPIGVSLACAALLLSPPAARPAEAPSHSKTPGVYISGVSKEVPSMSVSLGNDGSATISQDAGSGAETFFGHWTESAGEITVKFDAVDGKAPEPAMVFRLDHDKLQPVTWDHAVWGKLTPPVMKKGYKVKDSYWLTTVP
ncbi:MAG TPA: hypothetical protein VGR96_03660 [Acidobacteriaceae bacterium]|nr:hypothetical protein [Acidobacteriaceae bacterium]